MAKPNNTTKAEPRKLLFSSLYMFGSKEKAMSKETYAPQNPTEIHTNVLYEARQACYEARDAFYACLEKESDKKFHRNRVSRALIPTEMQDFEG